MGTSVLHIKTEVECRVYLFDEEKGIAKPGIYFNLEVRKGEQDLLFVSTEDECVRCEIQYNVEEKDSDYRITIEQKQFVRYSMEVLDLMQNAELGVSEVQYKLGDCYYFGEGVEQDYAKAVRWYRKAAEQGNTTAQNILGWCYEIGRGVEQDLEEAVNWFRKAAIQGNAKAQYYLGLCYGAGDGVERDYSEAVKWFKKSAEQGNADGQCNLGCMYRMGRGVTKDEEEAKKWFKKSAEQGNERAKFQLNALGGFLYKIFG